MPGEAVLTSTHNLCFGAKIRKISFFFFFFSDENFQILRLKKSLFSAWVSFRNVKSGCNFVNSAHKATKGLGRLTCFWPQSLAHYTNENLMKAVNIQQFNIILKHPL